MYNKIYINKKLKKDKIIRGYIPINYIKREKKEIINNINFI